MVQFTLSAGSGCHRNSQTVGKKVMQLCSFLKVLLATILVNTNNFEKILLFSPGKHGVWFFISEI